jgi:peroxiredoxin
VVVDPVERNAQVVESLGLDYRIAADPTLAAIDAYGLRHDAPGMEQPIARPATFVIDADGIVRWRDLTENYRRRPRPEAILAALDALPR